MPDENKPDETEKEPLSTEPAPTSSSRRGVLRWIAPVVLFVGSTLKPNSAQAGTTDDFEASERTGRCIPPP